MSQKNSDFIYEEAKKAAQLIPLDEIQRELLARQLQAIHLMKIRNTLLDGIKSIAVFFMVMYLLSMLAAAAVIFG
jgi:hypothetical protein